MSLLYINDNVWIIDMRIYGKIAGKCNTPNSYLVKTEKGNIIRRNRWHLVPTSFKKDISIDYLSIYVPVSGKETEDTIVEERRDVNENVDEANAQ